MTELNVQTRDKKEAVGTLREEGKIPAVFYGPKEENTLVTLNEREFTRVWEEAGGSTIVDLKGIGEDKEVLIHSVDWHPVTNIPIHVDFYQPRLDEKIKVMVPLSFQGEAPAVKNFEGTLIQNMHEVEVSALPQDLPSEIAVDVSTLKTFEDRILVENLQVDSKVEILAESDWIVAQVVPAENVEEELAKPVEDEAAAVEAVEKVEEKKEEQEEEGTKETKE